MIRFAPSALSTLSGAIQTYILASMRVLALALVGIGIVGLFLVIGDWPPTLAALWKVPTSLIEAFWIYLLVTYWYFGAAAVAIIALEVGLPLALLVALIRFLWKRA